MLTTMFRPTRPPPFFQPHLCASFRQAQQARGAERAVRWLRLLLAPDVDERLLPRLGSLPDHDRLRRTARRAFTRRVRLTAVARLAGDAATPVYPRGHPVLLTADEPPPPDAAVAIPVDGAPLGREAAPLRPGIPRPRRSGR